MIWDEDKEEIQGIIREKNMGKVNITLKEIIPCEECIYFRHLVQGVPYCTHLKIFVNYGWFCADGERRDK